MSDPARIYVIQGSCIGPLLFLLYVNSLTSVFDNVTCHLFANDVKLYTVIKTLTDCTSLQKGLDKVYDWSVAHQLPISLRKCSCVALGNVDTLNTVYNIGKQPIDRVSEVRDLSIYFDIRLGLPITDHTTWLPINLQSNGVLSTTSKSLTREEMGQKFPIPSTGT